MDNEAALVDEITEYAKGGKVECPSCGEYSEVVLARDTRCVHCHELIVHEILRYEELGMGFKAWIPKPRDYVG